MRSIDAPNHVTGQSLYLDDLPISERTLHAAVVDSPVARGKLTSVDLKAAKGAPGVIAILTAGDIPGQNQIGGIIADEPLFAESEVHFCGQPIAIVLAETEAEARHAVKLVELDIKPEQPVIDPREARARGELIIAPRTFALGDTSSAFDTCKYIFEGRADTGGQEHLYIETQGAYAVPMENGHLRISSSTQGPTAVQRTAAKVLGIPMHLIEVDVTRLGGGFGGKEDQATPWAVMAALAAQHLKRPVKLVLHRMDDMRMTGKRHPYSSDFKIGIDEDFRIVAFEAEYYQNAGAAADLSPAVLERTLFHATNSYYIPNFKGTAYCCRTNLPPNTAFRGFGGPQGMFVIEAAIAKAAIELGVPASKIQEANLLRDNDEFPFGQISRQTNGRRTWKLAEQRYDTAQLELEVESYNGENAASKKGFARMPICFGISFTKTQMNHARALVHIYQDGSVGVSTGAVEMGQGVNTKMVAVAAETLSIHPDRIKLETTNTTRVANTSPSAASATADLNGKALEKACLALKKRLHNEFKGIEIVNEIAYRNGRKTKLKWEEIIDTAFINRVCLSETAHYSTPAINFDPREEKGHPFAYHVFGTALISVTVDCIRGTYEFDYVKLVHDFGNSFCEQIDIGQIEGGLVQGLGWMTMEEVVYDELGQLRSNALSTYKIPDIYSAPKIVEIEPLGREGSKLAIKKSKAVGEPPLMYGLGGFFAIQNAIRAFNPNYDAKFKAPMTPERVLLSLYENR
ncbi:MAG: molybdopterin-dependent oxidoreductase [Verrucomicrobiales bacterium]|nr:molybdopterin-dependent oxidoreductase [Verrucomicrobiales bacterium]